MLITAGATRNPIDAVRHISALASGRTGAWLAAELQGRFDGVRITILGSPEACLRAPAGVIAQEFGSTHNLMARMARWVAANPGGMVVHSAAVGDYELAQPDTPAGPHKISSGHDELVLRFTPTPKILDQIKHWSPGVFLVSFKAASPATTPAQLVRIARAQLLRTRSDVVFANVLGRLTTTATLVRATADQPFDDRQAALSALADTLCAAIRHSAT